MRSLAVLLALFAAAPAFAQSPAPAPQAQPGQAPQAQPGQAPATPQDHAKRFQVYATSEGYRKSIGQLAIMGDTISAPECKEHKPLERAGLTVFAPPMFAEGVHPVGGLWMDRIKMDRCGTSTFQNILVQAQADGKPPRVALKMPGQTAANPPMQDLVMKDVVAALAKAKCSDTTKIIPVDTKLDKETKPRKINERGMLVEGAWKETWTFNACGKKTGATVDFAADGKGNLTHKLKM